MNAKVLTGLFIAFFVLVFGFLPNMIGAGGSAPVGLLYLSRNLFYYLSLVILSVFLEVIILYFIVKSEDPFFDKVKECFKANMWVYLCWLFLLGGFPGGVYNGVVASVFWVIGLQVASSVISKGIIYFRLQWLSLKSSLSLLAVNLVIFPLLFAIPLYTLYFPHDGPSSHWVIKHNMHTLQTIIETYTVDWGGIYPDNFDEVYVEANEAGKSYWKDPQYRCNDLTFREVFTSWQQGKKYNVQDILLKPNEPPKPCGIEYVPVKDKKSPILIYYLYGYDKNGQYLQEKGQRYFLTNS